MATHQNGVGLKVLARPGNRPWYGPGYCGICGQTKMDAPYSPLIPIPVRWWDPDDGWRMGVLCLGCGEEVRDRGPQKGDFAYHPVDVNIQAIKLDTLADFGDEDAAYSSQDD